MAIFSAYLSLSSYKDPRQIVLRTHLTPVWLHPYLTIWHEVTFCGNERLGLEQLFWGDKIQPITLNCLYFLNILFFVSSAFLICSYFNILVDNPFNPLSFQFFNTSSPINLHFNLTQSLIVMVKHKNLSLSVTYTLITKSCFFRSLILIS